VEGGAAEQKCWQLGSLPDMYICTSEAGHYVCDFLMPDAGSTYCNLLSRVSGMKDRNLSH
jgi:hypothetical protein